MVGHEILALGMVGSTPSHSANVEVLCIRRELVKFGNRAV